MKKGKRKGGREVNVEGRLEGRRKMDKEQGRKCGGWRARKTEAGEEARTENRSCESVSKCK